MEKALTMALDRADRELESRLSLYDRYELQYYDPALTPWRKEEVRTSLLSLKDLIDAWQLHRYEFQMKLDLLKKFLQDFEANNRRLQELGSVAKQAEVEHVPEPEFLHDVAEMQVRDQILMDVRALFGAGLPYNNGYDQYLESFCILFEDEGDHDNAQVMENSCAHKVFDEMSSSKLEDKFQELTIPIGISTGGSFLVLDAENWSTTKVFEEMATLKFSRKPEVFSLTFGSSACNLPIKYCDMLEWPTGIGNFSTFCRMFLGGRIARWVTGIESLVCHHSERLILNFKNARVLDMDQVIMAVEGINLLLEMLQAGATTEFYLLHSCAPLDGEIVWSLFFELWECRVPPDKYKLFFRFKLGDSGVKEHKEIAYGFFSNKVGLEIIFLTDDNSSTHKLAMVHLGFCKDGKFLGYQNHIMLVQTTQYMFRSYATLDYANESRDLESIVGTYSVSSRIQRSFQRITSQLYDTSVPLSQSIKKVARQHKSLRSKFQFSLDLLPPSKLILGARAWLTCISMSDILTAAQLNVDIVDPDILNGARVNEDRVDQGTKFFLQTIKFVMALVHASCLWDFIGISEFLFLHFGRADKFHAAVITDCIDLFDEKNMVNGTISCKLPLTRSSKFHVYVHIKIFGAVCVEASIRHVIVTSSCCEFCMVFRCCEQLGN